MDVTERRARLVARHHLAQSAPDALAVVRGVVALHSSDPITPYLAARARMRVFSTGDLDAALTEHRSLWRMHAMRRTLFVVPSDEGAMFAAAASRDIALRERKRVEGWIAPQIRAKSAARWLRALEARVLEVLADGVERRTQELSAAVPALATQVTIGAGKWLQQVPLASRLLFLMAMDGRIVRTRPAGSWRSSQYCWVAAARWFGATAPPMEAAAARAVLCRRYLAQHGPATLGDIRWWTGWTAKQAQQALGAIAAVRVSLDDGEGYVLPDDLGATRAVPQVAFLPGLDPTPMGWKERGWYLGAHEGALFDRNGNVGPTVWLDGRIVGGWAQQGDGAVVYRLLEPLPKKAVRRIDREAKALERWFDGVVTVPRFRTPLERELSAARP